VLFRSRRANAETQRIELQRLEQEARLELERERERMRQEQLDKQLEAQRLERERRYYSCLNGAIDRVGVAEASAYCSRFR
jgi:tRNA A-37 threonylcarbamoyl transferase component Bud32